MLNVFFYSTAVSGIGLGFSSFLPIQNRERALIALVAGVATAAFLLINASYGALIAGLIGGALFGGGVNAIFEKETPSFTVCTALIGGVAGLILAAQALAISRCDFTPLFKLIFEKL